MAGCSALPLSLKLLWPTPEAVRALPSVESGGSRLLTCESQREVRRVKFQVGDMSTRCEVLCTHGRIRYLPYDEVRSTYFGAAGRVCHTCTATRSCQPLTTPAEPPRINFGAAASGNRLHILAPGGRLVAISSSTSPAAVRQRRKPRPPPTCPCFAPRSSTWAASSRREPFATTPSARSLSSSRPRGVHLPFPPRPATQLPSHQPPAQPPSALTNQC